MKSTIVLSALGPDRPRIVDEVSAVITRFGLNIDKSRMGVMGAEFSLVALVSGEKGAIESFLSEVDTTFSDLELDWVARPTDNATARAIGPALPFILSVVSIDAVGLVAQISSTLGRHGANIEDLDSTVGNAAESGTQVFHLNGVVLVPQQARLDEVKQDLFALADDLNIDLNFDPA